MTKKPSQKNAKEIELIEDAWPRFEAMVKNAAKMGHKPHDPAKQTATKKSVGRKKT